MLDILYISKPCHVLMLAILLGMLSAPAMALSPDELIDLHKKKASSKQLKEAIDKASPKERAKLQGSKDKLKEAGLPEAVLTHLLVSVDADKRRKINKKIAKSAGLLSKKQMNTALSGKNGEFVIGRGAGGMGLRGGGLGAVGKGGGGAGFGRIGGLGRVKPRQDYGPLASKHFPDLSSCIREARGKEGTLVLRVRFKKSGKIKSVKVRKDSLKSKKARRCFTRQLKTWTIAAQPGELKLDLPIKLPADKDSPFYVRPEATVSVGKTTTNGALDKDIIRRVLRRRQRAMQYCYEKELQKNPKLAGSLQLKFTINAKGRVEDPKVDSSTINDSKVESCVLRMVKRMRFPQPKSGIVTVTYPLTFGIK